MKIDDKYHGLHLPAKFKLGVSGCPNQCAETCIKDIGLVGMPKGWKVLVGGNGGAKARLSRELVKDLSTEQAFELSDKSPPPFTYHILITLCASPPPALFGLFHFNPR